MPEDSFSFDDISTKQYSLCMNTLQHRILCFMSSYDFKLHKPLQYPKTRYAQNPFVTVTDCFEKRTTDLSYDLFFSKQYTALHINKLVNFFQFYPWKKSPSFKSTKNRFQNLYEIKFWKVKLVFGFWFFVKKIGQNLYWLPTQKNQPIL